MPDPLLIEDHLIARLKTLATVTAIVGSGTAARIRPGTLAQSDVYPAITIVLETETIEGDLEDEGDNEIESLSSVFQVCAIATTHRAARLLQKAIQRNGTAPGTGLAGFTNDQIQSCICLGTERELVDLKDSAGTKLEVLRTRYLVHSVDEPA